MIRYIVDIAERTNFPPELFLASALYDTAYDIFEMSVGVHPTDSYWLDWGGSYDNPTAQNAEIFFKKYLRKASGVTDFLSHTGTMLLQANKILIHLDRKPWQYLDSVTEYDTITGYASAPRGSANPSDATYPDIVGTPVKCPVRLMIPSVPNQLSDPISGTTLQTTFSISLINNDGLFDDTDESNIINTPITLRRADNEDPDLADFAIIRYGLVSSVDVSATEYRITAADINRTLTEPATSKFTASDYPDAPDATIDKDMPIGYGSLSGVPLFEVDTDKYIALDPDYITAVSSVYDKDGTSISFTFDGATGIITVTESDGEGGIVEAKTADVTGKTDNSIGEIITGEIEDKTDIAYLDGPWDKTETDAYIALSAHVNFYFKGGELKKFITEVLKNDNAFLFTKNDGRLTLRQWAQDYTEHTIPSWQLMEIPTKSNAESKRYFISSAVIQWDKNESTGVYNREHFYDDDEAEIREIYRRRKTGTFPTGLYNSTEISDLAGRLVTRFGTISEVVRVKLGTSVKDINPLDTVVLDLNINGRQFSNTTEWIVRDVDPAQDTLTMEGK
jgi:hypothetical protein